MTARARIAGLYAIADTELLAADRFVPAVQAAIDGGAALIQYRDKSRLLPPPIVEEVRTLCRVRGAPFIVNDDIELAYTVNADGVHVGRHDVSIVAARERLGPDAIVGVSCYGDLARALSAEAAGCDYVAFGSFYASTTKPDAVRPPLSLLAEARARLRVPIVAIGGITPENGARLIRAGADALAVITGLFQASDIRSQARRYVALFTKQAHETTH